MAAHVKVAKAEQKQNGVYVKHKQKYQKTKEQKAPKKHKKREVNKYRKVGRWYLGETLGKGGYSWVKKGYDRKDGRVVALKFTSKAKADWSETQSKQIQNEIEALRSVKDQHVLQLLAYNLNAKYPQKDGIIIPSVLLVLEYLPGGELFDILYYTNQLKEDVARTYFKQLMDGLEACHDANICHRDIKPQNLLLDSNFQLKIADFGLAKVFEKDNDALMRTYYVGTRGYQAPEILKKEPYTVSCDIFSCGVVLFILLAGYPPFEAASTRCRWYAPLTQGNAREFWKQHRGCGIPGKAKDLITRMLWYDKSKRIDVNKIRKHKWYKGKILTTNELGKELKKLHRLMEIKRKEDSDKQRQLQNSIKREICKVVKVFDKKRNIVNHNNENNNDSNNNNNNDNDNNDDTKDDNNNDKRKNNNIDDNDDGDDEFSIDLSDDENDKNKNDNKNNNKNSNDEDEEYYNGETIKNVAEIMKAVVTNEKMDQFDCTSIVEQNIWNSEKQIIYVNNLVNKIMNLLPNNKKLKQISDKNDCYLSIFYSDEMANCNAAPLPENETITLKDVFTSEQPRLVLSYIQQIVLQLGGTANVNFKNANLEANLATHNFPAPVTIAVRIFYYEKYECNLVKFERIGGDTLHFARVLRKLIQKCGPVLTGLPDEQFNATMQEKEEARKLPNFGSVIKSQ